MGGASGKRSPRRADAVRNRAAILAAAEAVFAERGPAASTEEVARRAGVAVGTVFRHFPTKRDLLVAILKALLARLDAEARHLVVDDPATGLFRFFRTVVDEAAARTTVLALLRPADDVRAGHALAGLQEPIAELLRRGQQAGSLRPDLDIAEVIALLTSLTEGALAGGWDVSLRDQVLRVVTDGLHGPG
jgi:AcrR family transcriptional regulator